MKERGMIFNAEMVRALLDGRKTQTRRPVAAWQRPSKTEDDGCFDNLRWISIAQRGRWGFGVFGSTEEECMNEYNSGYGSLCPFGKIGDRIWVRETFACGLCTESTLAYRASHKPSDLDEGWFEKIKWTPSIHMPRWASRITLEITDVRVGRLQDISEEDAIAEGVIAEGLASSFNNSSIQHFCRVWRDAYGDGSWNENPWVWVIEFKRIDA